MTKEIWIPKSEKNVTVVDGRVHISETMTMEPRPVSTSIGFAPTKEHTMTAYREPRLAGHYDPPKPADTKKTSAPKANTKKPAAKTSARRPR